MSVKQRGALAALAVIALAGCGPEAPARPAATATAAATAPSSRAAVLRSAVREVGAAAGAAAIVQRGRLVWSGAAGGRRDDLFSLASLSKPYVAALVLRLAEKGRLSLTDPVSRWLGAAVPPEAGAVRVRELLDHTSGLPDYLHDDRILESLRDPRHRWTETELLRAVRAPRGRGRYAYSNANYLLLGFVARRAGGASPGDLLEREVLAPLGLRRTALERRGALARLVSGRRRLPNDVWGPLFGDGGIVASATDVARFMDALLVRRRVLRPASLRRLLARTPGEALLHTTLGGRPVVGHDGSYGGWETIALTDRARGRTVVVLLRGARAGAAEKVVRALSRAR